MGKITLGATDLAGRTCDSVNGAFVASAAERFQVARPTAKKWSDRYRELGPAGMVDRSSRPHRSPLRTPRHFGLSRESADGGTSGW